jgi:hypothetical protein
MMEENVILWGMENTNGFVLSLPTDILGCVVSFLAEVDLYLLENAYPTTTDAIESSPTRPAPTLDVLDGVTKQRWYELCLLADHGHHHHTRQQRQQHQLNGNVDHPQKQVLPQDGGSLMLSTWVSSSTSSSSISRWGPFPPLPIPSLPSSLKSSSSVSADERDETHAMTIAQQRGRGYCRGILFARQIAAEAAVLYDLDVDTSRHNNGSNSSVGGPTTAPDAATTTTAPSFSPCWLQEWSPTIACGQRHGSKTMNDGVYTNLTLLDGTNRRWEGYTPIRCVSFTESLVSIDIATLVTGMRWTELSRYYDMYVRRGHEGALRDQNGSAVELQALMRSLQITIIAESSPSTSPSTSTSTIPPNSKGQQCDQYKLVLATGGFQSADVAYDGYLSSGAFNDRRPRFPLGRIGDGTKRMGGSSENHNSKTTKDPSHANTDSEGPYRTWMRISSHTVVFRMERPFLIL